LKLTKHQKTNPSPDEGTINEIVRKTISYAKRNSRKTKKTQEFPRWYAGITNDPKRREVGHKNRVQVSNLVGWKVYDASTFVNAREIEKRLCSMYYFQHCELPGNANTDQSQSPSRFIYIYYLPPQLRS
jgi:hypothetical protein